MKTTTRLLLWLLFIGLQMALLAFFKQHPDWVEHYYSNLFYKYCSQLFRAVLGFFPFSIGDLLYLGVGVFGVYKLVKLFRGQQSVFYKVKKIAVLSIQSIAVFFFLFNLLWGFNNYRVPLHQKLDLELSYTEEELVALTEKLIEQTTDLQLEITHDTTKAVVMPYSEEQLLQDAHRGLKNLEAENDWLRYKNDAIKKSLWSLPLTYMGFSGYINPFTNEAQVNYKVPAIGMIVTATHETAHQIGFAKESEANFIGYLGTRAQTDVHYRYAASLYALKYCLSTLEKNESEAFLILHANLNSGVLTNLYESTVFWSGYRNFSNSFFKVFYGSFLRVNNQKEGIKSYNRFVDLLINYHKKNPL